jgi:hypothetical protein
MARLTVEQMREASECMRKLVRKAGGLLVWADEELEELASHLQFADAELRQKISQRTKIGMARARAAGKKPGRPPTKVTPDEVRAMRPLSFREIGRALGISKSNAKRLNDRGPT